MILSITLATEPVYITHRRSFQLATPAMWADWVDSCGYVYVGY